MARSTYEWLRLGADLAHRDLATGLDLFYRLNTFQVEQRVHQTFQEDLDNPEVCAGKGTALGSLIYGYTTVLAGYDSESG